MGVLVLHILSLAECIPTEQDEGWGYLWGKYVGIFPKHVTFCDNPSPSTVQGPLAKERHHPPPHRRRGRLSWQPRSGPADGSPLPSTQQYPPTGRKSLPLIRPLIRQGAKPTL